MTKKITYLFIISSLMVLLSAPLVFAEDNNTLPKDNESNSSTKTDLKNDIKEIMGQTKEGIKSLREEAQLKMSNLKVKIQELKDKTKAKVQEDRINGREQALERFDNAVLRIENLKTKVAEQVLKLENKGVVVPASIKEYSNQADTKLNEAKAKITEANSILATSTNELSKDNKAKLMVLATDIQTLIQDAKKALNDEVLALKAAFRDKVQTEATKNTDK